MKEYKYTQMSASDINDALNSYAQEGWRVINIEMRKDMIYYDIVLERSKPREIDLSHK